MKDVPLLEFMVTEVGMFTPAQSRKMVKVSLYVLPYKWVVVISPEDQCEAKENRENRMVTVDSNSVLNCIGIEFMFKS